MVYQKSNNLTYLKNCIPKLQMAFICIAADAFKLVIDIFLNDDG